MRIDRKSTAMFFIALFLQWQLGLLVHFSGTPHFLHSSQHAGHGDSRPVGHGNSDCQFLISLTAPAFSEGHSIPTVAVVPLETAATAPIAELDRCTSPSRLYELSPSHSPPPLS